MLAHMETTLGLFIAYLLDVPEVADLSEVGLIVEG